MPESSSFQLASSLWADISGDSARAGVESAIARKTPAATDETKPGILTTLRPNDSLALYMPAGGSLMRIATRFVLAAIVALGMVSAADAETVMKQCGEQWQAAKTNGTTNGETWPQFLKQCRAQLASTGGASTAPQGGFAPAAPAPAPAPAPAQQGSLFPWQQPSAPAPAPAPAPANYSAPAPTGAAASAQQAQYRCPGATVVWVNEKSHIYHFPGTHDYGNTKRGAYMCEAEAQAAGNRAAKNERHP
jgi:hypothetical protein